MWEFGLSSDKNSKRLGFKGGPSSTREEREMFIKSKYVEKKWLQPCPWKMVGNSPVKLAEKLYDFCSKNDLKQAYVALAQYAANPTTLLESGLSVFHQLILDGTADLYTMQLLLLHSDSLLKKNSSG